MVAWRQDADCYQAHDLVTLFAAVVAGKLRRRPAIYDSHELASDTGNPASLRSFLLRAAEKLLIPRADRVIVPNHSRAVIYAEEHTLVVRSISNLR